MKAKLGIFLLVLCVVSFFFYDKKGEKKGETEKLMKGVVLSAVDNTPLSNVHIGIAGNNPATITNSAGEYMILAKPANELVFKCEGYRSVTIVASDAQTVKMEVVDAAFMDKANENLKP